MLNFKLLKKYIEEGNYDEAYNAMNKAYFGYYEVQGFEKKCNGKHCSKKSQ